MPKVAALILAAGASSRMGQPKQLLPWKHTTLLGHALGNAKAVADEIVVVLGANADKVKNSLSKEFEIIENERWKNGMGSSIAAGVTYLATKSKIDSILIMTSDQPLIDKGHLTQLLNTYRAHEDFICATAYNDKSGVPAIFPKSFFGDLKNLDEDFGARQLIAQNMNRVVTVAAKGKTNDIDYMKDYENLYNTHGLQ
ncbi:nucleotidyltransferase family protein [Allomuricauda sp. d1]|uniref:nucleotidyltransferase family protein n=1 Tax=Allomuricauda sp. d1 TaxID=3136725 RepID=UPI0031D4C3D7